MAATDTTIAVPTPRRAASAPLFAVLALFAGMAGLGLLPGAMLLSMHEGDAVHLMDIVVRLSEGEWPHVDVSTPIGGLAAWPMAAALALGAEHWFGWGQVLAGLVSLPLLLWAGFGRMAPWPAAALSGALIVLQMAVIFGGIEQGQSASMHYNRWGWSWMLAAFAIAAFPARLGGSRAGALDGAALGILVFAVGITKATYVVGLLPAVVVALAVRRAWATLGVAVSVGLIFVGLLTLSAPWEYWPAYAADLVQVARSENRAWPGPPPLSLASEPEMMVLLLLGLGAVVALRRAGGAAADMGLPMLLLIGGSLYVTAQNWANDPQWAWIMPGLLLGLGGAAGNRALAALAVAFAAVTAPSVLNAALSPLRMTMTDAVDYEPVTAAHQAGRGLLMLASKHDAMTVASPRALPGIPVPPPELLTFPDGLSPEHPAMAARCEVSGSAVLTFRAMAADLRAAGLESARVMVADYLPAIWLFGGGERVPGGTPWFYGLPRGMDNVDLVLVARCPERLRARNIVLEALARGGIALELVRSSEVQDIYRVVR